MSEPGVPHLTFQDVGVSYATPTGAMMAAVTGVNVQAKTGEVLGFVGPSGCGKTTILRVAAGLLAPTTGELRLNGAKITGPARDRCMVFQEYGLFPWLTAIDNISYGLRLMGTAKAERRHRAEDLLQRVGLTNYALHFPGELSGGMRQRVAIARAFAVQPDILLADEAFGHLDEVTAAELRETFLELARECGSTAVLITHQLEEAIGVGDRIVVFGKSAKLLADIHVAQWPKAQYAMLREVIQATLQSNSPDPRIQAQGLAAG
jgi:NitT/TauT family transport system ATP-binding protein